MDFDHKGYTPLWTSVVGSGMWSNSQPNDIDLATIYCADTHKILRGENIHSTFPNIKYRDEKTYGDFDVEESFMEIGHLINLLIKGNVNAIWNTCSPRLSVKSPMKYSVIHYDLMDIVNSNLSKESYKSIHGMIVSQYNDKVKRAKAVNMPEGKAYRNAIRTANFGIHLLDENKLKFEGFPKTYIPTEQEMQDAIIALDMSYEKSKLTDKPNEELFRDFLYHVRLGFMV